MEGYNDYNISCKKYLEKIKDRDKILLLTIGADEYLIFRGLTFPFMISNNLNNGNLNLMSKNSQYFNKEIKSKFFKPNGLRQLLDTAKSFSSVSQYDDSVLNIRVCNSSEIVNELDVDYITQILESSICKDLEFLDVNIDFDSYTDEDINLAFQEEYKILEEEYLCKFKTYFLYASENNVKLIKDKIKLSLY